MNKKLILLCATVGGIAGGYVPVLFGDTNSLDGWSILSGMIGGLIGIWVGAKLSRQFG